jgi:hypothetical protein
MSDSQHAARATAFATSRVFPWQNPLFKQWHAACFMGRTQSRQAGFAADTKTKKARQTFF